MKILIISEYFPSGKDLKFSGGVEARNYFISKYLAKKHNITIITSRLTGQKARERLSRINIIRVGKKRTYNAAAGSLLDRLSFLKEATSAGKSLNVDLVEGTNFLTHFIARQISNSKKVPCVAWYPDVWIGQWITNAGAFGILGEIIERINLIFGFDAYIAISKETASKLRKHTKKKIQVIYCGVDKQEVRTTPLKGVSKTILCVSRLTPYKNIKTLILAFADLSTRFKNIGLIIVGSGPELGKLKNLCKQLRLSRKIKFYSNLSRKELLNMYKIAHVFSLPSKVEGFGIATIEAASFGLPYVNSDIAIQKEITKNGVGGFLTDPDSPLEFSRRFANLLENKKVYIKKSKEAKNLSKLYDWQKISGQTEQVYKSLFKP